MTDAPESADALALSRQLCFAVHATARAIERRYARLLAPLGLTYPQYLVMLALWQGDGVPVCVIGERLHLDSGTLTPLLKRLEAAGHLRRARDPADERRLCVALTPQGAALKARAAPIPQALAALSGLAPAEIARLRDAMVALGAAMRPEGAPDGASDGAPAIDPAIDPAPPPA